MINITYRDDPKSHPKNDNWTVCNEPSIKYANNDDIINQYPDMKEAYDNFSKTYNIPKDNFILTSGTEASLRITLSAIRLALDEYSYKTTFLYGTPCWRLAPILAEQEGFSPLEMPYEFFPEFKSKTGHDSKNIFVIPNEYDIISKNKGSILYTPLLCNGYFNTFDFMECVDPRMKEVYSDDSIIKIFDEVYTAHTLTHLSDSTDAFNSDNFIIGSYSKLMGCGIRLGYILYNSKWNVLMQHQRENYISPLACMHTKVHLPNNAASMLYPDTYEYILNTYGEDKYRDKYVTVNLNYFLIKAKDYDGPADRISAKITVGNTEFYRLGMLK